MDMTVRKLEKEQLQKRLQQDITKKMERLEQFEHDQKKDKQEQKIQLSQKREERLIRMKRDKHIYETELATQHEDLMKQYYEKARNLSLHERVKQDDMKKREEEYSRK